jgi:hypothetical protein
MLMSAHTSGPGDEVSAGRWVESVVEVLRCHVTASDPVGCDQTGYLVEFQLDPRREEGLVEEIMGSADREWMAALLTAALLAYIEFRVAEESRESEGRSTIRPSSLPADAVARTPGQWVAMTFARMRDDPVLGWSEPARSQWLRDAMLLHFPDREDMALALAGVLSAYTVERVNAERWWFHRQVPTSREGVQVDAGMAGLIEALWAAGVDTQFSCECAVDLQPSGDVAQGTALVVFATLEGAYRFVAGVSEALWRTTPGYALERVSLTLAARQEGHPLMGAQRAVVQFPAADVELITQAWRAAAG